MLQDVCRVVTPLKIGMTCKIACRVGLAQWYSGRTIHDCSRIQIAYLSNDDHGLGFGLGFFAGPVLQLRHM
jgi:hypothetical protein